MEVTEKTVLPQGVRNKAAHPPAGKEADAAPMNSYGAQGEVKTPFSLRAVLVRIWEKQVHHLGQGVAVTTVSPSRCTGKGWMSSVRACLW